MRKKISFGYRQAGLLVALLVGALTALFSRRTPTAAAFAGGYAHAFPARFTLGQISRALLLQLLPPLGLYTAGFLLFCRPFCALILSWRAFAAGYICVGILRASAEKDAAFFVLFSLLILFEILSVLVYHSMSRLSALALSAFVVRRTRKSVWLYTKDQLFFCGLLLILYLMRGTVVLLLTG